MNEYLQSPILQVNHSGVTNLKVRLSKFMSLTNQIAQLPSEGDHVTRSIWTVVKVLTYMKHVM